MTELCSSTHCSNIHKIVNRYEKERRWMKWASHGIVILRMLERERERERELENKMAQVHVG